MQTKLAIVRSHLTRLQWMRAAVRQGSALCATLAMMIWLLMVSFLIDWCFDLPPEFRWGILPVWAVCSLLACRKWVWPLVADGESIEDVALMVERQHGIDSDLVAAIQFDEPQAKIWGSPRLANAVIDDVAAFSPSMNVFEGFSYQPLFQWTMLLGLTVMTTVAGAITWPGHSIAFGNRFLWGSAHYPTKTSIEAIVIDGQEISFSSESVRPRIRVPYGRFIPIEIRCGGELPASGFAQLLAVNNDNDVTNRVGLHRQSTNSEVYTGELTHLIGSFRVKFCLGDATSLPIEVIVVPLPLVDIHWDVTPPEYAKASLKTNENEGSSHQPSMLEGSTARLRLICANKRLKSARLILGEMSFELHSSRSGPPAPVIWSLSGSTPFETVREALKYEIQVIDEDDLVLEKPIVGQVRLLADRPPRIAATAVTQQVLPTAVPKLDYLAGDDFGIARIVAVVQISREDGRVSRQEILVKEIAKGEQPLAAVRGQIAIPFLPYDLVKGDEVKVVLEAVDWRGDDAGQSRASEGNTFLVTDLIGILAQTAEEDKKTAKQLDEILRRELAIEGVGK